jgi:hypothetical protein
LEYCKKKLLTSLVSAPAAERSAESG